MSEAEKSIPKLPKVEDIKEQADEAVAWVRGRLGDADKKARSFVVDRPIVSLLGAAGLGYLLARLVGRRR